MTILHDVIIKGIPKWVDAPRLLGDGDWHNNGFQWEAALPAMTAARLEAQLRMYRFEGDALVMTFHPPLRRSALRAARRNEARRMRQRSQGFTREGIRMDDVGRMSLTPETLAVQMAETAKANTVVDVGCGLGGNAIAFARQGCMVVAYESNPARLAMAKHNASVYGVQKRIHFINESVTQASTLPEADLLFCDPPWDDLQHRVSVASDFPLVQSTLFHYRHHAKQRALWFKLPLRFDTRSLPDFRPVAFFGTGPGDHQRIKFLVLQHSH